VRPPAKSFILDMLSTLRGGVIPVRALVSSAALLGIPENNVRVALARLLAAGRVRRDERGRYGLGELAEAVGRQIRSWRDLEERTSRWDGGWIAVHRPAVGGRSGRARRAERALRLLGFRTLAPGLEVRPDNLRGGVARVREQLHDLGLDRGTAVFAMRGLDAATEARARRLWDVSALRIGYRRTLAELERSERRLPRLSERAAMVESFLVGGRGIRQLVLDPLLPEPLVPAAERAALVRALRRYDRIGRNCWARFMRDAGAPHFHAPADTRSGHGPEELGAAALGGTA
jgi:phenylacetic acid degradation operon negative regulatory protein